MKRGWKIAATLAGAVLVAVLLRNFVATSCLIPSSGMEHTLYQGDRIWVNRWSYGLRLPWMSLWGYHRWGGAPVEKGDVVVFNNPSNLTEPFADRREVFIGRCVASPGDTLWVDSLFRIMPSAGSPDSVRRLPFRPRTGKRRRRKKRDRARQRCKDIPRRGFLRTFRLEYLLFVFGAERIFPRRFVSRRRGRRKQEEHARV